MATKKRTRKYSKAASKKVGKVLHERKQGSLRSGRSGKKVILEPKKRRPWPKGYWKSWGRVPRDFRIPDPLPAGQSRVDFDAN